MTETLPVQQLFDYWNARIQRDLTPFADPGTEVALVPQGRTINATWVQRASPREARFTVSLDGVSVQFKQRTYPYRSFFASSEMADLLALAKMILQAKKPRPYVDTKATVDESSEEQSALSAIGSALGDRLSQDATTIVMVTGDAGAGKTSVLLELVRLQAELYTRGQTDSLFLYVNAQGRALARFTEALAAELDELRSALTFHEITPLVRLGLITPVIDGFDELLGVGGYDEAFSSLSAFVEELDGDGQIVASARSTYYEQEFVARASTVSSLGSQYWVQRGVKVREWGDEQFTDYVQRQCAARGVSPVATESALNAVREAFKGRNAQLASKPLFVARTLDLVLDGKAPSGADDLLEALVSTYIERERTEKLLDRSSRPILTSNDIRSLLVELAEEMWSQETRELDTKSVRSVAEYVLGINGIDMTSQRVVIERMPTMAFLAKGERYQNITFEHETFFAFFFAQRLAERLCSKDTPLDVLLGRSVLSPDIARLATDRLGFGGGKKVEDLRVSINRICVAASQASPRRSQVQENGGRLVQSFLKAECSAGETPDGIVVSDIVIPGGDLAEVRLTNAVIKNVEFRRVDLRRTAIRSSRAESVMLMEVVIDPATTRLELAGLDPRSSILGLRVLSGGSIAPVFAPEDVLKALQDVGAIAAAHVTPPSRRIPKVTLDLVEKFVRAYKRANPICTSDDFMRAIFTSHEWPKIQKLLVSSGVVTEEARATSGSKKSFLRRQVLPEEIMAGLDPSAEVPDPVKVFWSSLESAR